MAPLSADLTGGMDHNVLDKAKLLINSAGLENLKLEDYYGVTLYWWQTRQTQTKERPLLQQMEQSQIKVMAKRP